MRIAFIFKNFQNKDFKGGGEKIFYHLIKELSFLGAAIDVYASETNIEDLSFVENLFILPEEAFYAAAMQQAKEKNYDKIISENAHFVSDISLSMGHSFGYRYYEARTPIDRVIETLLKPGKIKNHINAHKEALQYNSQIVVLSKTAKNGYSKYLEIPESKLSYIYPGVEIPSVKIEKTKNEVFTMGMSCPGFARKGGYILLGALAVLKLSGLKFKAKIINNSAEKNIAIQLILSLFGLKKNVEFLNFTNDMNSFYGSLDLFLMPSREESFGIVLTEAMAAKVLTVCSSSCGASEIVQDGINGYVFSMKGIPAFNLAKKIAEIAKAGRNNVKIIKEGYKTAEQMSWKNFALQFLDKIECRIPEKELQK